MMDIIALLPMKGHSERVQSKNIKPLNGKPLFYYIADTLRATNLFQLLAINTDSEEIARLAKRRYGDWVQVIERPPTLVGDYVQMNLIIGHDITLLGMGNNYLQTHSTNPLLSGKTIRAAVNQYCTGIRSGMLDSLFSVNALKTRLYDKDLNPLNHDPAVLSRTQDLDIIYEENSNLYIFSGESFTRNNHRIGPKSYPFVMIRNSAECIDIDEPSDWEFAEMIIKYRCKNG